MSRFTGPGLDGSPIGVARIDFVGNTAPLQQAATQAKQEVQKVNQEINKVPPAPPGSGGSDGPVGIAGLGKRLKDTVGPLKLFQSAITSTVGIFSGFLASAGLVVSAIAAIGNHFLEAQKKAVAAGQAFSKALRDTERTGSERADAISKEGIEDAARALDTLGEKYLEIRQKIAKDETLNFEQRQALVRKTYEDENAEAALLRARIRQLEADAAQRSAELTRRAIDEREQAERDARAKRNDEEYRDWLDLMKKEIDAVEKRNNEIQRMERDHRTKLESIRQSGALGVGDVNVDLTQIEGLVRQIAAQRQTMEI